MQVLGGGCNWKTADMRIYHNFWEGFKSVDMLEKYKLLLDRNFKRYTSGSRDCIAIPQPQVKC
jgi:hypothetical protein